MTINHPQWLRLRLKEGHQLSDLNVKMHTFFAMHQHLSEQGHSLGFYLPPLSSRKVQGETGYLMSNHPQFLNKARQSLSDYFEIDTLNSQFVLPRSYQLAFGERHIPQAV